MLRELHTDQVKSKLRPSGVTSDAEMPSPERLQGMLFSLAQSRYKEYSELRQSKLNSYTFIPRLASSRAKEVNLLLGTLTFIPEQIVINIVNCELVASKGSHGLGGISEYYILYY